MMKLKAQQVFDATPVLGKLIESQRLLPQKGCYRVARMHATLLPEWRTIAERHDALVTAYDYKRTIQVRGPHTRADPLGQDMVDVEQQAVPDDKMPEFAKNWGEIAGEEIEVNVEPIPLDHLTFADGKSTLSFEEFAKLGDLVAG